MRCYLYRRLSLSFGSSRFYLARCSIVVSLFMACFGMRVRTVLSPEENASNVSTWDLNP